MPATGSSELSRKPTNATARLSAVLDKLSGIGSDRPVADVLASVFEAEGPDQNRNFLLAYRAITTLLENSQREVETYLASEVAFYSSDFPPLNSFFSPRTANHQWNGYKSNLSANQITGIRHTAQRLKSIIREYEPSTEDKSQISAAINEMRDLLKSEPLSDYTRERLQECIDEIEEAVNQYQIWGSKGVDRAFKLYTGTIVADGTVRSELQQVKKDGASLWDKAMKFGAGLSLFLNILHGAHQFKQDYLPTLEKLLLPDTTHPAVIIEVPPSEPAKPTNGGHSNNPQVKI